MASETPIRPISIPYLSISCSVTEIGSSVGRSLGTSLNMYSAGNSISSLELRSLVCFLMKSYCANPSCGKPIIVSTIGRPVGIPIAGTSACDGNGMNCSAADGQGNYGCGWVPFEVPVQTDTR